jgi:hypothetical protein
LAAGTPGPIATARASDQVVGGDGRLVVVGIVVDVTGPTVVDVDGGRVVGDGT